MKNAFYTCGYVLHANFYVKNYLRHSCVKGKLKIYLLYIQPPLVRDEKYKLALLPSYLAAVQNSVGSKVFRNLYFLEQGKPVDVLRNGDLSCAHFVSFILHHFGLVSHPHTTVRGVLKDLIKNNWHEIKKKRTGAIIVYENIYFPSSGENHMHIGFYVGRGNTISTSPRKKMPILHGWDRDAGTGKPRKAVKMLWHRRLGVLK